MAITRWDPFTDLVSLREAMNRLFEESFVRPSTAVTTETTGARLLPLDIYQNDSEIVVKAPVAGVKPEDIDVSIAEDVLTIKGETKYEEEIKKESYILQERRVGSFYRKIALPVQVDAEKAQATFENGVLTLTIPKAERIKPKQIKVTPKIK